GTHRVLFNTRGVFEGPGLAKSDDLLALEADSGELIQLLAPGQGGDFTLSPDGTQLAIVRPDSVSFARSDGTDLRAEVLTFTPVITFSEYFFYPRPSWSPEGDSVLVAIPGENPFAESPAGTIRRVPAAGGSPSVLASISGDLFRPQGEAQLISPDGTTVAYLRAGAFSGEEELVLYRPATGESFTVATGTLQWKGWAPDSLHFAYTQGSGLDLFVGEVGTPPTALGSAASLRWINDRQYLVLLGVPGAWTLTLGELSAAPLPLVDVLGSDGAFVPYDFAR
ncbi:MAG: TolB family protein, partial [Anaerolineales bacterium]